MIPFLAFSCLAPDSTTFSLGTLIYCIGELTFGSISVALVFFFVLMLYLFWKVGVPMQVGLPFAVVLLSVLGGITYFGGSQAMTSLLILLIFGIGIMFAIALIQFMRR